MLKSLARRQNGKAIRYRRGEDAGIVGKELVYSSNGDANGVFYNIGTLNGAQAWTNPHTAGYITAVTSGFFGFDPISALVNRANSTVHTTLSRLYSYLNIDLGSNRRLLLKGFTFQNRADSSSATSQIAVTASQDNSTFVPIGNYNTNSGQSVWTYSSVSGQTIYYRYFRFHNNDSDYMITSEIELYGSLVG